MEQGTHQELMGRQGHYYNMASLQSLGMRRVDDLSHCDTKSCHLWWFVDVPFGEVGLWCEPW